MHESVLLLGLVLSALWVINPQAHRPSTSDKAMKPFHVEGLGPTSVIKQIAEITGLTIGLETDSVLGKEKTIVEDFPGGTKEDVANLCASLLKNGRWRTGADNSLVVSGTGDASNLGQVEIRYLEPSSTTRKALWESLSRTPEVNSWLSARGCKRAELFRGKEWLHDDTVTVRATNLSLEQLLADTAVQSHLPFWSILINTRQGDCEAYISLW